GVLLFTSLPTIPLLGLGLGCVSLAVLMQRQQHSKQQMEKAEQEQKSEKARPEERIEDYLVVDPMEMEIGVGLIRLADPSRGGDLLPRITGVRQAIAADIGILLPK